MFHCTNWSNEYRKYILHNNMLWKVVNFLKINDMQMNILFSINKITIIAAIKPFCHKKWACFVRIGLWREIYSYLLVRNALNLFWECTGINKTKITQSTEKTERKLIFSVLLTTIWIKSMAPKLPLLQQFRLVEIQFVSGVIMRFQSTQGRYHFLFSLNCSFYWTKKYRRMCELW